MPTPVTTLGPLTLITPVITGQSLSIDSTVLPYTVQGDENTLRLEVLIYNTLIGNNTPTLTGSVNQFAGSLTIDPTQQGTIVQFRGRNYDPGAQWVANGSFAVGFRFADPNGNVQVVTQAGVSGATQPTWNKTFLGTTNDTLLGGTLVWQNVGPIAITPTIKFNLLFFNSQLALQIAPPSAVRSYKGQSSCKIEWELPTFTGFVGVRVLVSTDPTGVNVPFTQYGDLVNNITRSDNVIIDSETSTVNSGSQQVVTTTNTILTVNFSSVTVPITVINSDTFYVMLSTVIQDPQTQVVFESQQNGPIAAGFVDLKKVSPTDFLALSRKEDVAGRLIAPITKRYPDLDLTPRSELRDLAIDPFSLEVSNMNVREWFSRVSNSPSAISQVDDQNGDGLSDTFDSSPLKQQLSRAYGLNATDTQSLIDKQFDILSERAGLTRGSSTNSVVTLTFYTFVRPTQTVTIPLGALAATVPDNETPALTFITRGSAILTPQNADSFYDPVNGWWHLDVPAECQTAGTIGDVGARSIRSATSGVPSGWNVTNLLAADFGQDVESNSRFAERIADALVAGVDSGTRKGYAKAARQTPGVIAATVVAAGDLDMLRDWDSIRQKHVFGTVDIYVRGTNVSQEIENVDFVYQNNATFQDFVNYSTLQLVDPAILRLTISNFSLLKSLPYTPVELRVARISSSFYLGLDRAQFDNNTGSIILNPQDAAYIYVGDAITQARTPLLLNGQTATNQQAIQALASAQQGTYTYQLLTRELSPLQVTPVNQPVLQVTAVSGPQTGVLDPAKVRLIRTNDFLLSGGSNEADDIVAVNSSTSVPVTVTLTALTANPVQIDSAMDIPLNSNGVPQDVLSVRSLDASTLYVQGIDYKIVPLLRYHTYGLQLLSNSTITNGQQVMVSYNKFVLFEQLSFIQNENVTLRSNLPSPLANDGFVHNAWLPESYSRTDLTLDSNPQFNADGSLNPLTSGGLINALVPHDSRYIKVTFNNKVMRENIDFTLTVDSVSGAATLARILTGAIPDGVQVSVSYFATEVFSITTQFPAFVDILANTIEQTKHAAADVLVKAMLANPVDITMTVELAANADPATVDARIRTAISITMDNAGTKLPQSEIIRQVKAQTGVTNVPLPLIKMAKSDASYDVGVIIPSNTAWVQLQVDPSFLFRNIPQNCWISPIILPDATIPGGGLADSFVGMLFEGQEFRRALTITDFLNSAIPSFYIIGTNDQIDALTPLPSSTYAQRILLKEGTGINPQLRSYRVTYQIFGEGGAKDITVSSTEYLVPGRITINYLTGN